MADKQTVPGPMCWINGALKPASEATVSVFDHGFLYGDGVFEGLRFYGGKVFRANRHLDRLVGSARAIALKIPHDNETLAQAIDDTIAASGLSDGYLRLIVSRGIGPLGIDPTHCKQPGVFIIASQLKMISDDIRLQGAKVIIAATRRLAPDGLDPRIKSLNYLNHILARMEANLAGADEAILLNAAGRVTEGSADNVFVVKNGTLLTPPVCEGALDGITREAVVELANQLSIPFREIPLAPYDLYTADECFLTGTAAELIPVAEVDGRKMSYCPGPLFRQLQRAFSSMILRQGE